MKKLNKIYQTNTITVARSLIALSFLTTLVLTPIADLFPAAHLAKIEASTRGLWLMKLNFFMWFDDMAIPYYASILGLIVVFLGFLPRIMCLVHAWITYSIFYTMMVVEGGDQICTIMTFLLIPIAILDPRLNGYGTKEVFARWDVHFLKVNAHYALLFLKLQIAILYLNAGVSKLFAPEWSNGTAIYYWFTDPVFGAPTWLRESFIQELFVHSLTVSAINWGVIVMEIFLFTGLFLSQRYKHSLFIIAFFFHFSIVFIHGLGSFWISMVGALVLYFLQPDLSIQQNLQNIRDQFLDAVRREKMLFTRQKPVEQH